LSTVEGRVHATRAVAPIIIGIKDRSMIDGYIRVVSGWLGVEPSDVRAAMRAGGSRVVIEVEKDHGAIGSFASLGADVNAKRERDVIVAMLRYPELIGLSLAGDIVACHFTNSSLSRIRSAMVTVFADFASPNWISRVIEESGEELRPLVSELAMVDIPVRRVTIAKSRVEDDAAVIARVAEEERRTALNIASYVKNVATAVIEADLIRQRDELHSVLQRTPEDAPEHSSLQQRISELEVRRRTLKVE